MQTVLPLYHRQPTGASAPWPRVREKYVFVAGACVFMLICYSTFVLLPPAELSERGRLLAEKLKVDVQRRLPDFEPAQLVLPPPNLQYGGNGTFAALRHMGAESDDPHARADRDRLRLKIDMEHDTGQIPRPKGADEQIDNEQRRQPPAPVAAQQVAPDAAAPSAHSAVDDAETQRRRQFVVNMTAFAWDGYAQYAWGANELKPNAKTGHSASIFGRSKLGATIIDAMDTLHIMGMRERFDAGRKFIDMSLNFDDITGDLSVFETNIRFIGGLLSLYALTGDELYKRKVTDLADRLLPAFDTPTGLPFALINLKSSKAVKNWGWATGGASILSEFGSLQLEFDYLSYITGNVVYHEKVQRIRDFLDKMEKQDGLYFNYINPKTGKWGSRHVSMGALGDSFYEYLLKSWLQTGKLDDQAHNMYVQAIEGFRRQLIVKSKGGLTYFAEQRGGRLDHKMDHLACFSAGMMALHSANEPDTSLAATHLDLAKEVGRTCRESYARSPTGLGPESFRFTNEFEAKAINEREKYYILRPEVVEGWFYLWRVTKNPVYREWAWLAVQSIEKHCRGAAGYSGISNVYEAGRPRQDDVQQSFFLAETLKYLYLIFSPDSVMPLDRWIFNTEAHPLPIAADMYHTLRRPSAGGDTATAGSVQ